MIDLSGVTVYVVGPKRTTNELMAAYLARETGATCHSGKDGYQIPEQYTRDKSQTRLVLWDCQGKDHGESLTDFEENYGVRGAGDLVAFFNVNPTMGIEEEAVAKGIRGIFYEQDPLDRLPRGIQAVCDGELWISRQVMSKFILNDKPAHGNMGTKTASRLLTRRELEILRLIAVGATNSEISDELSISHHTVKTHIYNIFKKIRVPNRLQAALWAAKNM